MLSKAACSTAQPQMKPAWRISERILTVWKQRTVELVVVKIDDDLVATGDRRLIRQNVAPPPPCSSWHNYKMHRCIVTMWAKYLTVDRFLARLGPDVKMWRWDGLRNDPVKFYTFCTNFALTGSYSTRLVFHYWILHCAITFELVRN